MASINYATREISCKIVYYGPGLSGKTTNLQIIHRKIPNDTKSEMVSLATETDRTLFFDFLPLDLGSIKGFATKFQLYTVPGQVYYNATRKLVLRGVDGVVFVADSQRDKMPENLESLKNLAENLKEYGIDLGTVPFVLQYNKRDLPGIASVAELDSQINWHHVPTFEAQAHQGVGVFTTLKAIGKIVIDTFNAKYSARQSSRRPPQAEGSEVPSTSNNSVPAPPPRPAVIPPPPPLAAVPAPPPPPPAPMARPAPPPPPAPVAAPMAPQMVAPPPPPAPMMAPPPPPPMMAPQAFAPPQAPAPVFAPVAPPPAPAPVPLQPQIIQGFDQQPAYVPPPQASQPAIVFTDFPQGAPAASPGAVPGLQTFSAPPPTQTQAASPIESAFMANTSVPQAPPSQSVAPVSGLQGFAAPPSPPSAPGSQQGSTASSALKKSRLDGTLDPSDLDAEIARYEQELAEQKAQEAARRQSPIQSNPGVNPNLESDPLASAFLTPEELGRLSGQDSFPTRRMPLGPGQQP
jgi:signal recognition particle receptor subunit beta